MKKRTDKQETVVAFVLDKSGSMTSVANATRSGFNEYVQSLENDKEGKYAFSLTLFNGGIEKRHTNIPLSEVEELDEVNYRPDGSTALYDAAMKTINDTERSLKDGQKVLVVVMTDGGENASTEYTEKDFHTKVKALEAKGNWSFVFLGANQDSWATAQRFGFSHSNVANFVASGAGVGAVFTTMSANTRAFAMNASTTTDSFFSEKDKDQLSNA